METATTTVALAAEPASAEPAREALVQARALTVRYRGHTAVDHVELTIGRGEVYALLGRNGSGKSSLVRALLGLQPLSAGSAVLLGHDPWHERAVLMRSVGYVPEEPQAPPEMTAHQLVSFCGRVHGGWDDAAVLARLTRFAIPLHRPFRALSKGQRKQVELALGLGHAPPLLVLDDPTLGLDPLARRSFFGELMEELATRRTTVLLATHDLMAVEGIADRIGVLAAGRLLVDEPLEDLKGRFRRLLIAPGSEGSVAHLQPVHRETRAWGVEVVVAGWRGGADAGDLPAADVQPLSLDEIFAALHAAEDRR